jgi:hypothetical protein
MKRCGRITWRIPAHGDPGGMESGSSPDVWCGQPHPRENSSSERIDDAHASVYEISTVSRDHRQTVDDRRRRDEAILDWHGFPGCAKPRQQFRPFQSRVRIPGQTVKTPDPRVEPAFQGGPLPSFGKDENPESQFAKNDGIDGDVWLMCAKPRHDTRIGPRLRRLAQNVGVDQVLHSASVDSESIGTKKCFRGQASSQSMAPSFFGAARRTRR